MEINVGFVENSVITQVAVFDSETVDTVLIEIAPYLPGVEFVKMSDLPFGAWIGWYRLDGVWTNPNPPIDPPEEEGE